MTVGEFREALPIHCYEAFADAFRRSTGLMAPGKDLPAECGGNDRYEERASAWRTWRGMLGPSDEAAICGVAMMSERDE